ncbi:MAG TPA: hypothetical protein VK879_15580 [Candidatus Sulfomarinibacteraceae bacterium]|nr:hypothetical protein [Candidatus Sulfomarinibacteraceae bacterium]
MTLVLAVYGRALALPFFSDDFVHIGYMDAHTFAELWQTIEGLGYYRPLTFTIWKAMYPLTDSHSAPLQHGLNLLLHFGNGLLVAWLAGRLWPDGGTEADDAQRARAWLRRFLSAALFLLFPFSYQAVPWIGALPHLLVTFLSLLALAGYMLGWRGRRGWLALSFCCALLALPTHENAFILPALLAAYELSRPRRNAFSRIARRVLLWAIPAVAWLPFYFSVSSTAGAHLSPSSRQVLQNTLYALQGASYPVTWLGGFLVPRTGQNPFLVAALLGLPVLIAATLYLWRAVSAQRRLRTLFPLAWVILAALPTILFLDAQYVLAGPRLLMLASAGIAWFWAAVVAHLLIPIRHTPRRRWLRPAVTLFWLGLVLVHSISFLRWRMHEHGLIGEAIDQAVVWAEGANRAGRTAVFVNFPNWIAPSHTAYPLGTEGVVAFPRDTLPPLLATAHTGRDAQVRLLRYADIRSDLPYHFQPAGTGTDWPAFAAEHAVLVLTDYGPEHVRLVPAGGFLATPPPGPPQAAFAAPIAAINLLSAEATREGDTVSVRLVWQVLEEPQVEVTVFVHAVDEAGQLVGQVDAYPVGGTYPFTAFEPGQIVEDIRRLEGVREASSLRLGVYRRDDGERLPGRQNGSPLPDDAVHLPLRPASSR